MPIMLCSAGVASCLSKVVGRACSVSAAQLFGTGSFTDYGVHPDLSNSLRKQGLLHPNHVQRKSLPEVLSGKNTVINAETGSGKTLCFLLPILQRFTELNHRGLKIPVPHSLILVPTSDLANQISSVYCTLAKEAWHSSTVYRGSSLSLKPGTHLVVGTPSSLVQYDTQRLLRGAEIVCVDEADVMLVGSEGKAAWELLEAFKKIHQQESGVGKPGARRTRDDDHRERGESRLLIGGVSGSGSSLGSSQFSPCLRQMIFTAATLPSGGKRTVHSLLTKWLPKKTIFVTTDHTHKIVPTVENTFIEISNNCSSSSSPSSPSSSPSSASSSSSPSSYDSSLMDFKFRRLCFDLERVKQQEMASECGLPKLLVFVNTTSTADKLYDLLTSHNPNGSPAVERKSDSLPAVERESDSSPWWAGKVEIIHKGILPTAREEALRKFCSGEMNVLVCTDFASRGLDLPGMTAVVQFDFPVNSADYLHRAGRTGRAGSPGEVVSYVQECDRDLARAVQQVLTDNRQTFSSIFSRNKMWRRKIKAKKQAISNY